jgi:hypothetical protein
VGFLELGEEREREHVGGCVDTPLLTIDRSKSFVVKQMNAQPERAAEAFSHDHAPGDATQQPSVDWSLDHIAKLKAEAG